MHKRFAATVVGAGPAGLAVVARLLDTSDWTTILWIDPQFQSGRLSLYASVPSNTKVKLFIEYCTQSPSLKRLNEKLKSFTTNDYPLKDLDQLDPKQGCRLIHVANLIKSLTDGIKTQEPRVTMRQDYVTKLKHLSGFWTVETSLSDLFQSERVFLATGSHPYDVLECPLPLQSICRTLLSAASFVRLDDALDAQTLQENVDGNDTVLIFGASHSAMLVLMNLAQMDRPPKRVYQVKKHAIRYAIDKGDWILYDNTGLKGHVAEWTKNHIDTNSPRVPFRYEMLSNVHDRDLSSVTRMIIAIGYARNELPLIDVDGNMIHVDYLQDCGTLVNCLTGHTLPDLYGYGIAFPEKVVDKLGNVEHSVGLAKFQNYVSKTIMM